jgi:class 3 adenylate cyclase
VAQAGEIIVSESTMRLVAQHVQAQALPATKVKGKVDALQIYNVVGMKAGRAEWEQEFTRPL